MAIDIRIRRIPIVWIFEAPESKTGKILERLSGGVATTAIGSVADAVSSQPALSAVTDGLAKIPGLGSLSSVIGSLKNKIIIPMLVNPSSLEVSKTPRVVRVLTKKGIVNQFYQSEPDSIKIAGVAAGQKSFFIMTQIDNLVKTTETGTRNIVTMIYKYGGVYKGYIDNFVISAKADQPNYFEYSFDFRFIDQSHFRIFLLSIRPGTLNEAIQSPGKFIKETLKLSASELINTSGISLFK